jgi:hypothetical protein
MARMHIIAKAALTVVGICVISIILDGFGPPLLPVYLKPDYYPFFLSWLIERLDRLPNYFLVLLSLFFSYELLVNTDKWAHKLLGSTELPITSDFPLFALGVYRCTAVFCGIVLIYHTVPTIEPFIRVYLEPEKMYKYELTFSKLIHIILAFYLICGAPHFVGWQVGKTLKYIRQKGGTAESNLTKEVAGRDIADE